MAIDINELTQAVAAELRNGATDLSSMPVVTTVADDDTVLAQSGTALKKIKVAAIAAKGKPGDKGADAVLYRLLPSALVYKSDTTAITLSLLKTEGESTAVAALPSGWVVQVVWNGTGGLTKSSTLTSLSAVNPNSLAGATSVDLALYTANPEASGSSATLVDSATLLLVADGKQGDKGDKGDKGDTGPKGADGSGAGSLILHPFDEYPTFAITALNYETGEVTCKDTPTGIEVGDYVAVVRYTKDNISWKAPLTDLWVSRCDHTNNAAIYYASVNAISGNVLTIENYKITGKGKLADPTCFMLVHYGAGDPTDDLSIKLPDAYKGKPIRIDLIGQGIMTQTGWNNWCPQLTLADNKNYNPPLDDGRGGSIITTTIFSEHYIEEYDWAYIAKIDTDGKYRRAYKVGAVSNTYDITTSTAVKIPWQFRVPFNEIRISLL